MASYNYEFSPKMFKFLIFSKKYCPECGYKLIRKSKHKFDRIDYMRMRGFNLTETDYYNSTFIYDCNMCNKSYTLEGLMNNCYIDKENINDGFNDVDEVEIRNMKSRNKRRVLKMFSFIIICMFIISLINSIYYNNIKILFITIPFVVIYGGILALALFISKQK